MDRSKLPIGIQTFRKFREEGYYYVDKTAWIRRLLNEGKHYFLSRPRRFGKSLFLDTLKELFEGNEALFEGLHIHHRWDWSVRHPVVRLSFGSGSFKEPGYVHKDAMAQLDAIEEEASVAGRYDTAPARLRHLIQALHRRTGQRAVILVDEYDKPILDALEAPETARANRDFLRGLYAVIKDCDANVRFTFLTGVSKFSKVSLFSGLNNLTDITLEPEYSAVCGYTEADLDTVFAPELAGLDREAVRDWYNGYGWLGEEKVYNPFDILLLFRRRKFGAYWFETGTPSFLIDVLSARGVASPALDGMIGTDELLSAFDVDEIGTEALLFQTGYLTIREEEASGGEPFYRLGYPNREVRQSLNRSAAAGHGAGPFAPAHPRGCGCASCSPPTISTDSRSCSGPSSPPSPTTGTGGTRSLATRATTRACSTPTSPRRGWTWRWRTRAATGRSTWRCASTATSTFWSSRWSSRRRRGRRWRSSRTAATRTSTALAASRIHLIAVEFSRKARNLAAFEVERG